MDHHPTPIADYRKRTFSATAAGGHRITHHVYSRGQGKVVVIIQELPGIGPETLALADKFAERGYHVVLPHLFGPLERKATLPNLFRVFCMRKEFSLFAANRSSPIVDWLKALCRSVRDEQGVRGVAVIGMCLTGNFAISLMADEAVLAGFASHPTLPFFKAGALHLSPEEINAVKSKLDEVGPMHCGRFQGDIVCSAKKFEAIDRRFNTGGRERIILHTLPGNGHSILTVDFVDEAGHPTEKALEEVMAYFDGALEA